MEKFRIKKLLKKNRQLLSDLFNLVNRLSLLKINGKFTEKYISLMNNINAFNHQI